MTEGSVHIFTTRTQPATRYRVTVDVGKAFWVRVPPTSQIRCSECGKRRWAKYMGAQVYYDMTVFTCLSGHGCRA